MYKTYLSLKQSDCLLLFSVKSAALLGSVSPLYDDGCLSHHQEIFSNFLCLKPGPCIALYDYDTMTQGQVVPAPNPSTAVMLYCQGSFLLSCCKLPLFHSCPPLPLECDGTSSHSQESSTLLLCSDGSLKDQHSLTLHQEMSTGQLGPDKALDGGGCTVLWRD